ncbi:hypothetical protein KKG05_08525 [bacterium]|nr:hypothetical protein [bacterium]MBU1937431.1 hypothetical protein [bacterium]
MRKGLILLLVCVWAVSAIAQTESPWREGNKVRAYVAPAVKIFDMDGVTRTLIGGRVVWVHKHHYAFGPEAYILARKAWVKDQGANELNMPTDYYLMMGYGGIVFEYIQGLSRRFYLSGELHGGTGVMRIDGKLHSGNVIWKRQELFVVAEPGVNLLMKLSRYVWLGTGVTHRFSLGLERDNHPNWIDDAKLSTLVATLALRFGRM